VEVAQLKERLRQLDEANKQDQQAIFDAYNRNRQVEPTPDSRNNLAMEIGAIQTRIARRIGQQKALRDSLSKLEAEVGQAKAGN
jgi:chromosome segregation ATPase